MSSDFGHTLSVGTIHLEDRFCAFVAVGGFQHGVPCAWQLPWLALEWPWSAPAGPC